MRLYTEFFPFTTLQSRPVPCRKTTSCTVNCCWASSIVIPLLSLRPPDTVAVLCVRTRVIHWLVIGNWTFSFAEFHRGEQCVQFKTENVWGWRERGRRGCDGKSRERKEEKMGRGLSSLARRLFFFRQYVCRWPYLSGSSRETVQASRAHTNTKALALYKDEKR